MVQGQFDVLEHFREGNRDVPFKQVSIDLVRLIESGKSCNGFDEAYENIKRLPYWKHFKLELPVRVDDTPYLLIANSYGKGWFVSLKSA